MEILSTRPQCLTIEARHTISLEVARQRRLRVASSLFMPRKNCKGNQSAQEDDMNPQAPASSEGLRMLPWYGSGDGSAPKDSANGSSPKKIIAEKPICSTQNPSFSRPYNTRLALASSGNNFVHSNKYTGPAAGRFPPPQAQESARKCDSSVAMADGKKAQRSQPCSRTLSDQQCMQNMFQSQQALSRLVGQLATTSPGPSSTAVVSKSQTPCFFADSTSEQIVRTTSAPTLQSLSASFGVITDAAMANASASASASAGSQENTSACQQNCQNMSTQTGRPSMSPGSSFEMCSEEAVCYASATVEGSASNEPQVPVSLSQNQQVSWQISNPSAEPPRTLLNSAAMSNVATNTFVAVSSVASASVPTPAPAPSQISYENVLRSIGFQGSANRAQMQEAGPPKPNMYLPPSENLRLLSELCQAKQLSDGQTAMASDSPNGSDNKKPPAKRATKAPARNNQTPRKTPEKAKRQPAKKANFSPPENMYQGNNQQPSGCIQQFTYIICPPVGNHNLEICQTYSHSNMMPPNQMPHEVRYRPYQFIPPPAIMYHQPMRPVQPPSAPDALPASLAPADMARWLASRYQQPPPQPQKDYNEIKRQLAELKQALVRYNIPQPAPPAPPQNNQNFMKSFYEQYTGGAPSGGFYDNPNKQTTNCYSTQDNRSPQRNYALPKMMDSGNSNNCGPNQNYFTGPRPPMNGPSPALMYGMGHPQHGRRVNFGPAPPPGVRFPHQNQKPMDSGRVPSTISPAMGGLSINEQVPGEYYRNMVNVPEYDPRDNR